MNLVPAGSEPEPCEDSPPPEQATLAERYDRVVDLTVRAISEAVTALLDPDHRIEVFRRPSG